MNFKMTGYTISILFGLQLAYIISGVVSAQQSLQDVIWYLVFSVAMVALGVWLAIRKPKPSNKISELGGKK
ncbi:hypothetical protein ACFLUR_01225 [Chloroflexota bacterium]